MLIGLSDEILLFELLHHGWDSCSVNSKTEQTAVKTQQSEDTANLNKQRLIEVIDVIEEIDLLESDIQ